MKNKKQALRTFVLKPNEKFAIELLRVNKTTEELSDLVGLSRASLSMWVHSDKQPKRSGKVKISEVMNMSIKDWNVTHSTELTVSESLYVYKLHNGLKNDCIAKKLSVTGRTVTNILRNTEMISDTLRSKVWALVKK